MTAPACPMCEMNGILTLGDHYERLTCGHERPIAGVADGPRVVKDTRGNVPAGGAHGISCKMDGIATGLKAQFAEKVVG